MVSVKFENTTSADFGGSIGLMGEYGTGKFLGRDGTTLIQDPIDFAEEWQVLDTEPKLFQATNREPQHPRKCVRPQKKVEGRRRLGEPTVARDAAEKACASWGDAKESCIYDVMATGDIELALAGGY